MLIWNGLGFLAAIIPFFMFVVTQKIVNSLFSNQQYYSENAWPKIVAIFFSALFVYMIGKVLNQGKGRVVIDKATGKEFVLKTKHALFFIDIKYWPYIIIAFGIIMQISSVLK